MWFSIRAAKIDRIADTGIRGAGLCAGVACDHFTGCDPDADIDLIFIFFNLLRVKNFELFKHFKPGAHSPLAMIFMEHGRAKYSHESIANHLIDRAAIVGDGFDHQARNIR